MTQEVTATQTTAGDAAADDARPDDAGAGGTTATLINAIEADPGMSSPDGEVARPPYLGREDLDRVFSVEEFEPLAAARMHPSLHAYIRGPAGSGWTMRNNAAAFRRWMFRPRILVD